MSISTFIDWVENDKNGDALHCDSAAGRELTKMMKSRCDAIVSPDGGVYAWVCPEREDNQFIYVGMTGSSAGRAATLRWRLFEELRDERAFLWKTAQNNLDTQRMRTKWATHYKGDRAMRHLERSILKAGTTHIIWTPTPNLRPDQIHDLERWLIAGINPQANLRRTHARDSTLKELACQLGQRWKEKVSKIAAAPQRFDHKPKTAVPSIHAAPAIEPRAPQFARPEGLYPRAGNVGSEGVRNRLRVILRERGFDWYSNANYGWILGRKERWVEQNGIVFGFMMNGANSPVALRLTRGATNTQDISYAVLESLTDDQVWQLVKATIIAHCTNKNQIEALRFIGDRDGYNPDDYLGEPAD